MRLADMTEANGIVVSEELAQKCNEATDFAQQISDLASERGASVDGLLVALGVLIGQHADTIGILQQYFLTMEHAAVASHANRHGQRVQVQ